MKTGRQVILKNQSKHLLKAVEAIQLDLYKLVVHHPDAFKSLCELCHGLRSSLSQEVVTHLKAYDFLDSEDNPYDDVTDVVQSGTYQEGHTWKRCAPLQNIDDGEH